MDQQTARYIIIHFPNLITSNESMALRHTMSLEKLGNEDRENSVRAKFFRKRGLLTEDPIVLDLLKDGYDVFEQRTCERIMAECPEKVFFNYCSKCNRLARTPYARQCRYCGHNWHEIIAAKFLLNAVFSLTNRGFYFLGQIMEGEVKKGQFLDLTMLRLASKPKISSIEYARRIVDGQPTEDIGLGTNELHDDEMEYLRKIGSFAIPLDILKER